ncbi:ATP-binding cassette domain-containing protein [Amaricoccus sp.]|uniref:cell division ATP-binding protein FtsE n=1 Tax=Amaricoccus sp. TaxID=1872485 RepID=UPI0026187B84|nr:ATP-binding cassette domain-containing protein [uncultured Amaricoccus sp.]
MIEFEQAGFSYGQTDVLRDMSLKLAPGSFQFLIGPSGAGKTTLLRLCYMDLAPTRGVARFFGRTIAPTDRDAIANLRRSVGVVHQDCQFLDHLPLIENIALPLLVNGIDTRERRGDLEALLEWVDLTGRVNALPPELSGGERQRAALARAVILSPEVILADEPTGNVDWEMAVRLLTLLIELNRMGKTVLIATHDLNLIRAAKTRVSARVLRLRDGELRLAGADL